MLTSIELGAKTITAVTVNKVNGRGPEIVRAGTAPLAQVDAASLREAMAKIGADAARAVLVIPRGQAVLREIELPDSTPEELVAMVRFQVEKEMPLPLDQVRYSFVEAGRDGGKVRIQVAAVPREVIDPAVAALEAAGVKVAGAYVSSFGLLSLCPRGIRAAMVEVGGGEAEILVAEDGRMEYSRTATIEEGASPELLVSEIHRSLLAYAAKSPGKEIRRVVLAGEGPEATALAEAIRGRLEREVTQAGPGDLETAPLAGLGWSLLAGARIPDLLHPPVESRKFKFTRVHRIAGLAALIFVMLAIWSQVALSDRRADLARKRAELEKLKPRVAAVTRQQQQTQLAHQWYHDRTVWLDVLTALRQNMNTANLWIVSASFEDPGVIRIQGKARDDAHVTTLVGALTKTDKFKAIAIDKIGENKGEKSEYRKEFTLNAQTKGYEAKKKK